MPILCTVMETFFFYGSAGTGSDQNKDATSLHEEFYPDEMASNSLTWIFQMTKIVILPFRMRIRWLKFVRYQWILLGKLYKLMESFFQILNSFFNYWLHVEKYSLNYKVGFMQAMRERHLYWSARVLV